LFTKEDLEKYDTIKEEYEIKSNLAELGKVAVLEQPLEKLDEEI
jgi:hypothetical protein